MEQLKRILYEACPLCGSSNFEHLQDGDCSKHALYQACIPTLMRWMICVDCAHCFTEGHFSAADQAVIMGKTHENQRVGADFEASRRVSAHIVEKVISCFGSGWMPNGTTGWLDIGFGNGSLLMTAMEYGFIPVGVESRPDNIKTLKSIGIDAYADGEDVSIASKYSVISMADVLEHIVYPKAALKAARDEIQGGGLLFLSMPNSEAPLWRYMNAQNQNPYWGELEHYHNFTRTRLFELLRETGFTPIRYGISERYRCCMEVIARAA